MDSIDHPLEGGSKVCLKWSRSHDKDGHHLHIYGKNLYKASSPELRVYDLKLCMQHWELKFYKSGINDDLWLTLTYFTARSKLVTCEFEWKTLLQSN